MQKFCYSCGAPVDMPDFKGPAENFCKYCTDETGDLKSREVVKVGISQYLKSWQPDLTDDQADIRADHYMNAMPAWAE
ncbi:hypothetical protein HQ585_19670 [candidate division KSB1 bacterium]|nr:hypothetical protein [candidate division KSB1 bacterium]